MCQDKIYARRLDPVPPFEFNEQVVEVFDDMIGRSVPLYREIILRQAQIAARFHRPGTRIYDLGCSNGNLGLCLCREMGERPFEMIAVDSSGPMIESFRKRLAGEGRIRLLREDIRNVPLERASVVTVNLTLQFLPPEDRDALIRKIHGALEPGGILLLTEKVVHPEPELAEVQREFYHRFKGENGYSRLEISQKREALENVLIPETLERHRERLRAAGFASIDVWLKWFNFAALLCRKKV